MTTLAELAADGPPGELTPLDRAAIDADVSPPFDDWHRLGAMRLPALIPESVIDAYCERFKHDAVMRAAEIAREAGAASVDAQKAVGYGIGTPYLSVPELRDIALHRALTPILDAICCEPMGLHLNLTGWRSTTRQWHQDQYLNPPCVGWWYAAAWFALDDIHIDAGPFEYVPGSHRWPAVDRARVLAALGEDGSDPDWPWRSEAILGPVFDREIVNRGAHIERFVAHKGDVLLWHPNLCHRGSTPKNLTLERRALICHYSAVSKRCDMRGRERRWESDAADGMFFALGPVS